MSDGNDPQGSDNRGLLSGPFFATALMFGGLMLFLNNLGVLPGLLQHSVPIFVVLIWGVGRVVSARDRRETLVRAFQLFWAVMLAGAISSPRLKHVLFPLIIPLALISLGFFLVGRFEDPRKKIKIGIFYNSQPLQFKIPEGVTDYSLMGVVKRRVETDNFPGGKALAILGNIELDLRRARVVEFGQSVEYEIEAYLGAVKLRVPENWRVEIRAASILGTFEDKTVPISAQPPAAILMLTGTSFMSNVEIEA